MSGYDSYRDSNGIGWTVVWPAAKKRHEAIATVLDTADPKYDPEPGDITVHMAQGGVQLGGLEIVPSEEASGEQQRVLYIELIGDIETYAKAHRSGAVLKVTASVGTPWWVWGLLGLAMLSGRRR